MVLYRVCFPFLRSEAQKWKTKKRGKYRSAEGKNADRVSPVNKGIAKLMKSSISSTVAAQAARIVARHLL